MAKKKIHTTLDDLAKMVASGFENTATKQDLKGVETKIWVKLTEHDARFNKLENRVDEIYEILARFEEGDIKESR